MNLTNNMKIKWSTGSSEISAFDILHSLPDAVFTTDRQMRINYFNLAASELTGFSPQEAVGMYCKDVLKVDLCETQCPIKKALDANQNIFNVETTISTDSGNIFTILISASLLMDSSGEVVGCMHIFRDISPLKKVVFDLEISRNNLAGKNLKLDSALKELKSTQKQLLQAQKMESMGTLAGGIAHDFNNILTGILGYASLLKIKINRANPMYDDVDTIEKSAIQAARLTQQLLTFSRSGSYQPQVINVNKTIKAILSILARTISKKIHIQKSFAPDLWTIEADPSQIEQVVLNICVNARDAMPDGGKLSITTENLDCRDNDQERHTEGKYVKISIADTGEGISEKIQSKIFDPFFTTKDADRGTGLGLAVAYGVIKKHRGDIEIHSRPGKGSTFDILLPISDKEVQKAIYETEVDIRGGCETILVVDDEQVIRKFAKEILETKGYVVLTATNGLEAVDVYKKEKKKISLVILDIIMPEMDGIETYKCLREIDPSLKILIASAYSPESHNDEDFHIKADEFIEKPYKTQELRRKIRYVLDN